MKGYQVATVGTVTRGEAVDVSKCRFHQQKLTKCGQLYCLMTTGL